MGDNNRISKFEKKINAISDRMARLNQDYEVFKRTGLKKSNGAKLCLEKINKLALERKKLEEQELVARQAVAANMLLCVAGADFACETANLLERRLKQVFDYENETEKGFIDMVRSAAQTLAKIVVLMDKSSDRLSVNFAEMSDEIMDTMTVKNLEVAAEILKKHMVEDNGKKLLITKQDVKSKQERGKDRLDI